MKTIVDKKTAVSIYLFDDDTFVHEDIKDAPKDWVGHKYIYDGTTWKANSDWVDPSKSS
jgi:hypothetical protein